LTKVLYLKLVDTAGKKLPAIIQKCKTATYIDYHCYFRFNLKFISIMGLKYKPFTLKAELIKALILTIKVGHKSFEKTKNIMQR
jgi:hypothetical protein